MSWIEERKGQSCWVAVYKVDGKKIVKSTGVPLKLAGKKKMGSAGPVHSWNGDADGLKKPPRKAHGQAGRRERLLA